MSLSKKAYKAAKRHYQNMPWWVELIWAFNFMILFYGRDKPSNGRPR